MFNPDGNCVHYKAAPYNMRDMTDAEIEQMDRDELADREYELSIEHENDNLI